MPVTATQFTNKERRGSKREEKKMNSYTNTEAIVNECDAQET